MIGQTSRCFMVCSSPHSHVVCPSSLNPHFCIRDLHRPVPVRRRFRLDQVGHVSLEPGGSDSLGLNESLCGVVWRWLDQRVSLRVRALPWQLRFTVSDRPREPGCCTLEQCLSSSNYQPTRCVMQVIRQPLDSSEPQLPWQPHQYMYKACL